MSMSGLPNYSGMPHCLEKVGSHARSADFARIVEVWEASVSATHSFVTGADIQVFRPLVWDGLRALEHLLAVRDTEERVVGFMGVEGDEVDMLFVHSDWRGRGIGRRLLTHAVVTLGATRLDVNEQKEQALGFCRRIGFTVVGRSERGSKVSRTVAALTTVPTLRGDAFPLLAW